jgi:hypothetical protein
MLWASADHFNVRRLTARRKSRDEVLTKFGESLRVLPGRDHPDYEDARKLYSGTIDKRPHDRSLRGRGRVITAELRPRQRTPHRHTRRRPQWT